MKKITLLVAIISFTFTLNASNKDSSTIYFEQAYSEIKNMLEATSPLDFEKAVFLTENAYWDNEYTYYDFQETINAHLFRIKLLAKANNKSGTMDFETYVNQYGRFNIDEIQYLKAEKEKLYNDVVNNWAIFTYITDTTYFLLSPQLPFTYNSKDPFGMDDWANSQVINLLASENPKGNCFALTALFKIFADRLNSEARLCTAPQHIYLQHKNQKGNYYNVELATASHPRDGSIQTLTYTTPKAITSGIALREFDDKQNIGLCLVNLAKGYEHKFNTKDDEFIMSCAELALKYDSLNLNALLLKQQVLDARITGYAITNNKKSIQTLKKDPKIAKEVQQLKEHLAQLFQYGYIQMPREMQEIVMNGFKNEEQRLMFMTNKNPNPFTSIEPLNKEDGEYVDLSHGIFQEVFEPKALETYGHFIFNTKTKHITSMDLKFKTDPIIDPVAFAYDLGARMYDARLGRFLSVDPDASKYHWQSPYAFADNSPIMKIDYDGRGAVVSIDGNTITIKATVRVYTAGDVSQQALISAFAGKTIVRERDIEYQQVGDDGTGNQKKSITMHVKYEINVIIEMDSDVAKESFEDAGEESNFYKIVAGEDAGVNIQEGENVGVMTIGTANDDDEIAKAVWRTMVPKGDKLAGEGAMSGEAPTKKDLQELNDAQFGNNASFPQKQDKLTLKAGNKANTFKPKKVDNGG